MSDPTQERPSTPSSLTMMSSSVSDDSSNDNFGKAATPRHIVWSPRANERSQSAPKSPSPPHSRSFAERIVDGSRVLQKIAEASRLFTDYENLLPFGLCDANSAINQTEVEALMKYSVSLELVIVLLGQERDAEGQACFIMTPNGIVMATVKHNFCKEINKDGHLEEILSALPITPPNHAHSLSIQADLMNWDARSLTYQDENAFKFNANDNPDAAWKYGKELEFIPLNVPGRNESLLEAIQQERIATFEAVSTTFKIEEGMLVGIMACSCVIFLLAKSMQNGLVSAGYEAQQGDIFITVGSITHVGTDHIEYYVNTVPGFTGGPVFLLKPGEEHDMKLIAIHSGFSEAIGTNFGFLVAEKVEQYNGSDE